MAIEYDIYRNNFLTLDIYYGELTRRIVEMTPSYVMESFFSKFITHKTSAIIYGIDIPSMHEHRLEVTNLGHYNDVITSAMANHQPRDCLLNRLFRRRSKKTPKLRVTGLSERNSPVTVTPQFPFDDFIVIKLFFDTICFAVVGCDSLASCDNLYLVWGNVCLPCSCLSCL